MIAIQWAIGIIVGYAVFQTGGVDPAHWNPSLIAVGLAGLASAWLARSDPPPRLDRFSTACLVTACSLSAFQLVPLPLAWLRFLSPVRYADLVPPGPLGWVTPAFAPLSTAPWETAQYLLTIGACLAVFLIARQAASAEGERPFTLTWPIITVGAAEAGLGLYQAYAEGSDGYARGTYASYDHYAALLELILPFALLYPLAVLQRDRKRHESPVLPAVKACVLFGAAALMLLAIVHSLSRMGFLTVISELSVCGLVALVVRPRAPELRLATPLWYRLLPVAIVACIAILGFIYLPTDPLIARFSTLAHTDDIMTADVRAQIWRDTTRMIREYFWFGCGWGGYQWSFLRFKTVAPMNTIDYAHNDYLQVMAEGGIIVFFAGMLFLVRLLYKTLRVAAWSHAPDERYFAIACAASFCAILLHSFVDFNLYVPANAMLFAWIAGFAGAHLRKSRR